MARTRFTSGHKAVSPAGAGVDEAAAAGGAGAAASGAAEGSHAPAAAGAGAPAAEPPAAAGNNDNGQQAPNAHAVAMAVEDVPAEDADAAAEQVDASPLIEAATEGDLDQVMVLVDASPALVYLRDGCGQSALMWASYKGRSDVVAFLLSRGAVVNQVESRRQRTALYLACEFGHDKTVDLLLRAGADPSATAARSWTVLGQGINGWTPLIIASYNNNLGVVRILLKHAAAVTGSSSAVLDAADEHGASALWWAAKRGRADCVRALLDAGADWSKEAHDGKCVLTAARERGHADTIEALERKIKAYELARARRLFQEEVLCLKSESLGHTIEADDMPAYLRGRLASGYPLPSFDPHGYHCRLVTPGLPTRRPRTFGEEIGERAECELSDAGGSMPPGTTQSFSLEARSTDVSELVRVIVEEMRYDVFLRLQSYLEVAST